MQNSVILKTSTPLNELIELRPFRGSSVQRLTNVATILLKFCEHLDFHSYLYGNCSIILLNSTIFLTKY